MTQQIWKMLATSDLWSVEHKENGQPVITVKPEFFNQMVMHKWLEERHTPEFERLFVERIGQPANDDFAKN